MQLLRNLSLLLTLSAAAVGASGCGLGSLLDDMKKAQEEAAQEIADGYKMRDELLRYCEKLGDLPRLEIADYTLLRGVLKAARPEVWSDGKLNASHVPALRRTHGAIASHLRSAGMRDASRVFARRTRKEVSYANPGYEKDLHAVISRVLEVDESNPCARAYLALYYSQFVSDLEPLASLKIEGVTTEDSAPALPAKVRSVGRRGWVGLGRARDAGELAQVLGQLEVGPESVVDQTVTDPGQAPVQAPRQGEIRWVIDLRGTGGWSEAERALLSHSLEVGWKIGKIEEVWLNEGGSETGGILGQNSLAAYPVRALCYRDVLLGGGKVEARLTLSCAGAVGSVRPARLSDEEGEFLRAQAARWDREQPPKEEAPAPSAGTEASSPMANRSLQ